MRSNLIPLVLWLAFVGLWLRVFQQTRLHDVANSLEVLLGFTLLYVTVVAVWVVHNISLARRRTRRRAPREITVFPSHDTLGLPVEVRTDLLTEREIDIEIVEGAKRYLPKRTVTGHPPLDVAVVNGRRDWDGESELTSIPEVRR